MNEIVKLTDTSKMTLVQDWERLEHSDIERAIWKNQDGKLIRFERVAPEVHEANIRKEKLYEEARVALNDADEPVTTDGILWLTAVAQSS